MPLSLPALADLLRTTHALPPGWPAAESDSDGDPLAALWAASRDPWARTVVLLVSRAHLTRELLRAVRRRYDQLEAAGTRGEGSELAKPLREAAEMQDPWQVLESVADLLAETEGWPPRHFQWMLQALGEVVDRMSPHAPTLAELRAGLAARPATTDRSRT